MSNQVRKNTVNPMGSLYHHSLIKLLIMHQLKERNQTWENFVFKVLNPHLNARKHPRHTRDRKPSQTTPKENKRTKVVHIDEDTSKASPHGHSPNSINPVAAEFLPFPQV